MAFPSGGQGFWLSTVAALIGCTLVYDTTPLTGGSDGEAGMSSSRAGAGGAASAGGTAGTVGSAGAVAGTGSAGAGSTTAGSGAGPNDGGSAGTLLGDGGSGGVEDFECSSTYYVDGDGDGYGNDAAPTVTCLTQGYVELPGDCDDDDPYANPGLSDVCDGIDNDCDAGTDDVCPLDCEYDDYDGHVYLHCWVPQTATEASALCAGQLMRLARLDDALEQTYLWEWHTPDHAWVGGSDAASEGTWRWEDGEILWDQGVATLYVDWEDPEPNNLNGSEHCLMLNGDWNHWNDNVCDLPQTSICERY